MDNKQKEDISLVSTHIITVSDTVFVILYLIYIPYLGFLWLIQRNGLKKGTAKAANASQSGNAIDIGTLGMEIFMRGKEGYWPKIH